MNTRYFIFLMMIAPLLWTQSGYSAENDLDFLQRRVEDAVDEKILNDDNYKKALEVFKNNDKVQKRLAQEIAASEQMLSTLASDLQAASKQLNTATSEIKEEEKKIKTVDEKFTVNTRMKQVNDLVNKIRENTGYIPTPTDKALLQAELDPVVAEVRKSRQKNIKDKVKGLVASSASKQILETKPKNFQDYRNKVAEILRVYNTAVNQNFDKDVADFETKKKELEKKSLTAKEEFVKATRAFEDEKYRLKMLQNPTVNMGRYIKPPVGGSSIKFIDISKPLNNLAKAQQTAHPKVRAAAMEKVFVENVTRPELENIAAQMSLDALDLELQKRGIAVKAYRDAYAEKFTGSLMGDTVSAMISQHVEDELEKLRGEYTKVLEGYEAKIAEQEHIIGDLTSNFCGHVTTCFARSSHHSGQDLFLPDSSTKKLPFHDLPLELDVPDEHSPGHRSGSKNADPRSPGTPHQYRK